MPCPRWSWFNDIIGGYPGASADNVTANKRINWKCPFPGCGWTISKKFFETSMRFNQRIIRHYVKHFQEKEEGGKMMTKGCFIKTKVNGEKTYCDLCEARLPINEPVTKVFEYLKTNVLINNYCNLCWPSMQKKYRNFENATLVYNSTHI